MSRNKTNEILTVYLRKRRAYIHLTQIVEFSGPAALMDRFGDLASYPDLPLD